MRERVHIMNGDYLTVGRPALWPPHATHGVNLLITCKVSPRQDEGIPPYGRFHRFTP